MVTGYPATLLAVIFAVVLFGGLLKGLVGFGYAIASTATLATVLGPTTAVVAMILPTMVATVRRTAGRDVGRPAMFRRGVRSDGRTRSRLGRDIRCE